MSAFASQAAERTTAEAPATMHTGEIRLALEKLNVLGRVLYVAAHPDDENTGLIAYWANGALYETAYLSVTRGDGGQNLIGPELGDRLGVIRTQELLAAREIDRGRQFFTRANDFGFSKSAEETQRIWDREKILADVVWTIRKFRPDIIVTRFPLEDDRTHGHHTSSAQLALEAFRIAGDPKRFPEQLEFADPWQPTRILWNTSQFFFRARNVPFDATGLILVEAGGYQPLLGKSYAEIDAASRTMHKSQGFGVRIERGEQKEYFKLLDGKPVENNDLFSGVDTTWSRVPKAAELSNKVSTIIAAFDMKAPARSVPALLELRRSLLSLGNDLRVQEKLAAVDRIIAGCLGLHMEAVAEKPAAQPGDTLSVQMEAINRSEFPVKLKSAQLLANGQPESIDTELRFEQLFTKKVPLKLPETLPFSQPYWLRERGALGTFTVANQTLIGLPENPAPFPVVFRFEIGGQEIAYEVEPRFRKVDRVEGETSQPLVIAPPLFIDLPRPVFVFGNDEAKTLYVRVIAAAEKVAGTVALEAPAGWKIEPASAPIELQGPESEATLVFQVTPLAQSSEATLRAFFNPTAGQRTEAFSRTRIEYPHIEPQTLISPAKAKLVRADIQNKGLRVGYLPGAGDTVPESLTDIATEVKVLEDREVKAENLARYDAVVIGVRASNAHPHRVSAWMPELLAYAKQGGVVIMQYTTTPGPKPEHLPYPLKVSRDRVTDETAEVRMLAPDHRVLNTPNKITKADFHGWVQERGLYFPNEWDTAWTPILSSNDPGEKPADGGLLVTRVEKGWFVYTGYAFFRELPAGVPGAYRLFANIISLGKQ